MKVGLITYHCAYNFGSVLQAYATQRKLEDLCESVEMINYKNVGQYEFYSMYRTKCGIKTMIKDLLQFPIHRKRKLYQQNFEKFCKDYMHLSKECGTPEAVEKIWKKYDAVVSGSDQLWNKHSDDMRYNSWEYMDPYILKNYQGKKISFASSIVNMTDNELKKIEPEIKKFQYIAMRELEAAKRMENLLNRKIETVLDPTFLLKKEQWIKELQLMLYDEENFILYYSRGRIKDVLADIKVLKRLAKSFSCKIKVITPSFYIPVNDDDIENHPEYGPIEFLQAIYNAKMVITDAYHGTILPINFHKDVYSINRGLDGENRKTDFLNRIGLQERIISGIEELERKTFRPIDYDAVQYKIDELRKYSINYLKKALEIDV